MASWAGPGPHREPRGAYRPEQSWGAGTATGGWRGAGRRTGPARPPLPGESGPRVRAASPCPGGRQRASERCCAPPPLPPALGSNKGAGPRGAGRSGAGPASGGRTKLWSRRAREAGSGRPQPAAGFLPPRGEEEPPAPEADWGITGSRAPLLLGHFCRRKTSVWQTWCLRACSRFSLGTVLFLAELPDRRIAQVTGILNRVSKKKKILVFFRTLSRSPHFIFKERRTTELTLAQPPRGNYDPNTSRPARGRWGRGGGGGWQARRARGSREQVSPCIIEAPGWGM